MSYVEVDELEVLISADASKFRKEIAGLSGQLTGLGKTGPMALAGKLTPALLAANVGADILTKGIGKTVQGIKSLSKSIISGGSDYSRLSVATETVAKNMGIASEEVDDLRLSLADANTYGIAAEKVIRSLALTGLFQMAEGLEAVDARSGATEEGVSALVLTMKDLAAAAGMDSVEGIEMLTRFIQGNAEAVQSGILQIGNLGTEYRMFAESIGKTRAQLTAQEEAQARMNILMREGQKAFGAYANTYTTSGKMMSSITESFQATLQLLGSYLEPIFATVTSAVLKFVNNVREFLISNEKVFRDWAVKVASWVVFVVRTLGALMSRIPIIGKFMKGLSDFEFPKLAVSAENTAKSIGAVGGSMDNATNSAKALKKELAGLAAFDEMNVLNPPSAETGGGGAGGMDMSGLSFDVDTEPLIDLEGISRRINEQVEKLSDNWELFKERSMEALDFSWFDSSSLTEAWNLTMIELNSATERWLPRIRDSILGVLGDVGEDFSYYGEILGNIVNDVLTIISGAWLKHSWGIMENAGQFIDNLVALFGRLWTDILEPLITPFLEAFNNAWDTVLKDALGEVMDFIYGAIELGWILINQFVMPIANSLIGFLSPIITEVGRKLGSIFQGVFEVIGYVIKGIFGILNGLIVFIKGVFTGNWKNAWSGIIKIFSSLFGMLGGIAKSVINYFIREINHFITNISRIKIPNWVPVVGGKGFNIRPIPYLAEGGVIDSPTVAMLGEAGKEAVIPLENNTELIKSLAEAINEHRGGEGINLTVKLGEKDFYKGFIDYLNDVSLAGNSKLLRI